MAENESIQLAINNASAGDTVCVQEGTYSQSVVVNKSITLEAQGDVILDGNGMQTAISIVNSTAPLSAVTVSGFTIVDYQRTGIQVGGHTSNVRIDDTGFENVSKGIVVGAANGTTIQNVSIEDSYANGTEVGVTVAAGSSATVNNVTVNNVTASNASVTGVNVSTRGGSVTDVTLSKLFVNGSASNGLLIRSSDGNVTALNLTEIVVANDGVGVSATAANGGTVGDVSIQDSFANETTVGVDVTAEANATIDNVTLQNVTATNTSIVGVNVSTANGNVRDVTLSKTLITESAGDAISIRSSNGSVTDVDLTEVVVSDNAGGISAAATNGGALENFSVEDTLANDTAVGVEVTAETGTTVANVTLNNVSVMNASVAGVNVSAAGGSITDVTLSTVLVNESTGEGVSIRSDDGTITGVNLTEVVVSDDAGGISVTAANGGTLGDVSVQKSLANGTAVGLDVTAGLGATVDNVTVDEFVATNSSVAGVNISTSGGTITDVTLSKSLVNESTGDGVSISTSNGTITGVNLTEVLVATDETGLSITAVNGGSVGDVTVQESLANGTAVGVALTAGSSATVDNVTFETVVATNTSVVGVNVSTTGGSVTDVTMSEVLVNESTGAGVSFRSSDGTVSGVNLTEVLVATDGSGISVTADNGGTVGNVSINKAFANGTAVGVDLTAGSNAAVDNVTVEKFAASNTSLTGVNVSTAGGTITDVKLDKVLLNGSAGTGLAVSASNGTVTGVNLTKTIVAANAVGVSVAADNGGTIGTVTAETVVVQENTHYGVRVDVATGAHLDHLRVSESLLRDNTGPAIFVTASSPADNIDVHNSFIGRNGMGVDNANASAAVDARFNYWGDSTGAGSATGELRDPVTGQLADGNGDTVSEGSNGVANVRFSPAIGGKDENRKNIRDGSDTGADPTVSTTISGTTISDPVSFTVEGETVSGPVSHFVGISVWERSLLPLRANTSAAATTVTIPETFIRFNGSDASINRDELAAYTKGTTVTFEFSKVTEADTTRFANEEAQVVFIRTNSTTNRSDINSTSDLRELFQTNVSSTEGSVNLSADDVKVVEVRDIGQIDGTGTASFTFTPQQAGEYMAVLATVDTGDGYERTADGGLAYNVTNDTTTIIGTERIMVQEANSTVTPESSEVRQGQNVTFTAESNLGAANVTHVVMAYDKAAFEDQTVIMEDVDVGDENATGTFVSLTGTRDGDPFFVSLVADESGNLQQFTGLTVDEREVTIDSDNDMTLTVNGSVEKGPFSITITVSDTGTVETFNTTGVVEFNATVDELSDGRRFRFTGRVDGDPAFLEVEVADDGTVRNVETSETNDVVQTSESLDSVDLSFDVVMDGNATENVTISVGDTANLSAGQATTYQFVHIAAKQSDPTVRSTDTGTLNVTGGPIPGTVDISNVSLERTRVTPGSTVEVTVDLVNPGETAATRTIEVTVNGAAAASKSVTLAGGESTTRTFKLTFNETGNFEIVVDGVVAGVVTVAEPAEDTAPDDDPDTVVTPTNRGVRVTIDDARANETIDVELADTVSGAGVTFERMRLLMRASNNRFRVVLSRPQQAPLETAPALDNGTSIAYLTIDPVNAGDDIERAEFRFRVDQDRIPETASPEDVRLFHYEDGKWQVLETEHLGGNRFEAVVTGFSPFAVGTVENQSNISVTNAEVSPTAVEVDETVDVTATVKNNGSAEGTFTTELQIDGNTVATREVTVPAGETRTVTFTYSFSEPGTYEVAVNGVNAGTVDVSAVSTATPTATATATEETVTPTETATETATPEPAPGRPSGLVIGLLIVVVLAGLLALYWRREGRFPWQDKP